ncbi:sodium/phosphate symporter [halophilic archaeon]|nr:sodium/phosphate symporter [halophilic archaeon]
MTNRRSPILIGLTVFLVAIAMRTIPLYWSPLPFNLDGIKFAALARTTLRYNHLPLSKGYFNADVPVFTMLLALTSRVTGVTPLYIAQIFTASIGGTVCLFVVVITQRIGVRLQKASYNIKIAAAIAGLVLATEGIFLGRSAAVTSEGVGHLFSILSLYVFAHALWSPRPAWILLTGLLFFLFPLTHNLSTIVGAFSAVSLLVLALQDSVSIPKLRLNTLVAGFWIYTGIYYTSSSMKEIGRVSSVPGLFVAWVIVLLLSTAYILTSKPRFQREISLGMLFVGGSLVIINYFTPVFPGTATGNLFTVLFILPIAVIGIVAFWGIPSIVQAHIEGYATVALLIGTLSLIGFALTAGLTVQYQDLAVRGQIFLHIALAILAGIGTISLSRNGSRSTLKNILPVIIIVCSIVSAPLAFSGLHATSAQPLVMQTEFETATFAVEHANNWTSDGHITKLASDHTLTQSTGSRRGVYQWLRGDGSKPICPVISQRSWVTVGAQLFPSSPAEVSQELYRSFIRSRNKVYTTTGRDPTAITTPLIDNKERC